MPVTVDTPLCVTDQTRLVTVVGKHIPEGGEEGGREGRMEGGREGWRGGKVGGMDGRQEERKGGRRICSTAHLSL